MATGLTRQYYTKGGQGTFVYSPDIAVFVQTQKNGVIDLSPHIVNFQLSRVVNDVSTFTCTFDNKYAIYDRRIRRMDRIVVFMKRISWVQVFSGYVTSAPWQTVVPGDASLTAECTLKRLKHSYFDPWTLESQEIFPFFNQENWYSKASVDGGAGATIVRLLTQIALWDMSQIQIQKLPKVWLERAAKLVETMAKNTEGEELSSDYQTILDAMNNLFDAMGWQGYLKKDKNWLQQTGKRVPETAGAGVGQYSDAQWKDFAGKTDVNMYPIGSGNVALTGGYINSEHPEFLFNVQVDGIIVKQSFKSKDETLKDVLYLRLDAADALAKLLSDFKKSKGSGSFDIEYGYLTFDEASSNFKKAAGNLGRVETIDGEANPLFLNKGATSGIIPPVNDSNFTWGTAIKIRTNSRLSKWFNENNANFTKYGWHKIEFKVANTDLVQNCFEFRGSPKYWDSTGRPQDTEQQEFDTKKTSAGTNLSSGSPQNTFSDTSVFSFMFYYPGMDWESNILTGSRAWINDVQLLDFIKKAASASQRDFMSAPNGDFVAFFPDRLGQYSNFPTIRVRDIEVVDFKAIVSDDALVTHFISFGDFMVPTEAQNHNNVLDTFFTGAMLTVQQPDVLKFLLGLPANEAADLGSQMIQMFGIRPKLEKSYFIRNTAYNFAYALHKFQEYWANQWRFLAEFTFLPEVYPGMRIELVDREPNPLAVYVESVTHSGNRTSGFTTSVAVSTPTVFQNGRWTLLKPEVAPDSPLLPQDEAVREDLRNNSGTMDNGDTSDVIFSPYSRRIGHQE